MRQRVPLARIGHASQGRCHPGFPPGASIGPGGGRWCHVPRGKRYAAYYAVWIARGSKAKTGEELAQEPSSTSKAICGKQTAARKFVLVNSF